MATIDDVARDAGVSRATVSRAFSRPGLLSAATLHRVLDTARTLGYQPSRRPASARQGVLGVVVPGVGLPFFESLLRSAQAEAQANSFPLLIGDAEPDEATELAVAEALATRVDGLILVTSRLPEEAILDLAARIPVVLVNRQVDTVPSIQITSEDAMADVAEHLHQLGHRDILYMTGSPVRLSSRVRTQALRDAAAELGLEVTEVGPFKPHFDAGVRAAEMVLGTRCTAVIAWNDLVALGLMARAAEVGVKIGYDLSVVGFDDSWLNTLVAPALTTVSAPIDRAGTLAVRHVLALAEGSPVEPVVRLPGSLVVRSSTGRPNRP